MPPFGTGVVIGGGLEVPLHTCMYLQYLLYLLCHALADRANQQKSAPSYQQIMVGDFYIMQFRAHGQKYM